MLQIVKIAELADITKVPNTAVKVGRIAKI